MTEQTKKAHASDLITWLQALHGGKVLPPRSYAEMIKPATLNDGTALRYGMGLSVGKDSRASLRAKVGSR